MGGDDAAQVDSRARRTRDVVGGVGTSGWMERRILPADERVGRPIERAGARSGVREWLASDVRRKLIKGLVLLPCTFLFLERGARVGGELLLHVDGERSVISHLVFETARPSFPSGTSVQSHWRRWALVHTRVVL